MSMSTITPTATLNLQDVPILNDKLSLPQEWDWFNELNASERLGVFSDILGNLSATGGNLAATLGEYLHDWHSDTPAQTALEFDAEASAIQDAVDAVLSSKAMVNILDPEWAFQVAEGDAILEWNLPLSISLLTEPFVRTGIYGSPEQALKHIILDYIERQIAWAEAELRRYEHKYQHTFAGWTESLVGQASITAEDDWMEWEATLDMLEGWRQITATIEKSYV